MASSLFSNFLSNLKEATALDATDCHFAVRFAEEWRLSLAEALLDLHYVDETTLAKVLAKTFEIPYVPGAQLNCDFGDVDYESFDDLLRVGALPLLEHRLAIFNPYEDLRGNLGKGFCERDMVVTERSVIFDLLRKQSLLLWVPEQETED